MVETELFCLQCNICNEEECIARAVVGISNEGIKVLANRGCRQDYKEKQTDISKIFWLTTSKRDIQ